MDCFYVFRKGVHRLARTAVFFCSQGALPERLIPGASEEVCMQQLLAGYATFRSKIFPQHSQLFAELAYDQEPQALFITCCDSRVMPEMILQCVPGQILCCRNAGNLVPPAEEIASGVATTIEHAVCALRVPEIIVCGHSDCEAMRALLDDGALKDLPLLRSWLRHAGPMSHAFRGVMQDPRVWPVEERLRALTELNVIAQLRSLGAHPSVARALKRGSVRIHGWVYEISNGEIRSLDPATGSFRPLLAKPQRIESALLELMTA
jgi:carbonic anhydrase